MMGKAGMRRSLARPSTLATEMYCSSRADDGDRHDGRVGLDGEAHEAEAELGQLVALVERLRDAARPLGEDEQRLALREQPRGVLGHADDLADAREEERHEGQAHGPLLDHRAHDARRLGVHEHGGADERAVDAEPAPSGSRRAGRAPWGTFSMPWTSVRKYLRCSMATVDERRTSPTGDRARTGRRRKCRAPWVRAAAARRSPLRRAAARGPRRRLLGRAEERAAAGPPLGVRAERGSTAADRVRSGCVGGRMAV